MTSEKSYATEARLNKLIASGVDTWTTFGSLSNGWTGTLRYRARIDGEVSLNGHILAGTLTGGTIIATLPAGYRPASVEQRINVPVAPSGTGYLLIETNGNIECAGLAGGTTDVWINARFPLD